MRAHIGDVTHFCYMSRHLCVARINWIRYFKPKWIAIIFDFFHFCFFFFLTRSNFARCSLMRERTAVGCCNISRPKKGNVGKKFRFNGIWYGCSPLLLFVETVHAYIHRINLFLVNQSLFGCWWCRFSSTCTIYYMRHAPNKTDRYFLFSRLSVDFCSFAEAKKTKGNSVENIQRDDSFVKLSFTFRTILFNFMILNQNNT